MANEAMDEADQQALMAKFEHVEHEEMGEGTHERFLKIAHDLAEAYQVPHAQMAHGHEGCGCTHHHK